MLFTISNQPLLHLLELYVYLKDRNLNFSLVSSSNGVLIFNSEVKPEFLARDLGSLIKVGIVKVSLEKENIYSLKDKLKNVSFYDKLEDNSYWALSLYQADELKPLLIEFFNSKFKEEGIKKVKLLKPYKNEEVYSYQLEKVIKKGFEVVAFLSHDKYYLGKTLALTDTKGYFERDFKRPYKKSIISLPPRLARILSNLVGARKNRVILDPFCGTGTILQEAMMLNADVIGIDIKEIYVKKAKENLAWLKNRYGLNSNFKVLKGDATRLSEFLDVKVNGIATEPILLPPLRGPLSKEKALNLLKKPQKIYYAALREFKKVLKEEGRIAIILPYILTKGGETVSFPIKDQAKKLGLETFLPKDIKINYPLFYKSEKEKVVNRGLWMFKKIY